MIPPRKRTPWSRGDRLLMIVLALVLTAAGLGVWFQGRDRMPAITVPTPVLPSPNAYDLYVKAGNSVTGANLVSPVHQPAIPTAAQAAVVRQNATPNGAIGLLHQGFQYPYVQPPARSFFTIHPVYAEARGLARLLALQARVDAAQGDWAGAVTADLDCIRMGEDLAHGSGMVGMGVGNACETIGRHNAWDAVNHLSAAQARAAARRLEAVRARHVPFADTMQEEKWVEQAGLLELMRRPDWPAGPSGQSMSGNGTPSLADTLSDWKTTATIRAIGKQAIWTNVTRTLDQRLANARQPYAAHPSEPVPSNDPISQNMFASDTEANMNNEEGIRIHETQADTENALLLTLLALRAYRLDHGTYPAALSALTPGYLKAVPDDPFALSGPLRYKLAGAKFVLYSVGPDGKDDGGKPIFDATKPAPSPPLSALNDRRYRALPNSRGDIVAGVNIY